MLKKNHLIKRLFYYLIVISILPLFFLGCRGKNVGVINYRKACPFDSSESIFLKTGIKCFAEEIKNNGLDLEKIENLESINRQTIKNESDYIEQLKTKYKFNDDEIRKYISAIVKCSSDITLTKKFQRCSCDDCIIKANESISIHLQRTFIKDFPDITKRGEIAIVVKAFELKKGQDIEFDNNIEESGRLVYFSDDVRKEQFLNFSYLPIYGPISYRGKPIVIQIYILELDETEDKKIKSLLSILAKAGATAYPPSSPILSLLDDLGAALLTGDTDDILFRYSMVLYPTGGFEQVPYPVLETGSYIFIRKEERSEPELWANIGYDPYAGCVLDRNKGNPKTGYFWYRDETHLIFQIQKGFDSTDLDLANYTYKNFISKMNLVETNKEEIKIIFNKYIDELFKKKKLSKKRALKN